MVVAAHSHALTDAVFSLLGSLCDNHFKLRTGKVRTKTVRMLDVVKANGMELDKDNLVVFEVVRGMGAQIVPMTRVRA